LAVLYVAGPPQTGSTLVSRVLGEVDSFLAPGEIYALTERTVSGDVCGCGGRILRLVGPDKTELPFVDARPVRLPSRQMIEGGTPVVARPATSLFARAPRGETTCRAAARRPPRYSSSTGTRCPDG
jgi:hypothetical protein